MTGLAQNRISLLNALAPGRRSLTGTSTPVTPPVSTQSWSVPKKRNDPEPNTAATTATAPPKAQNTSSSWMIGQ
ncbi:hypothetical protein [Allokutzneria oryzae]|uniref:Uncharacterized protein n=1 Tax=Allokutzneria oryzae TaxID=1378989 RepID=A0ABV5ZXS3_9PSEU